VYSNFLYRRWFRTIEINGRENIPENTPVIFAPNHQNGFIDAMALLSSSPKPVVFLARADLFKKKMLDKMLRALKVMPAYRSKDGIQNLKKNEDSFEQAVQVLLHKEFFCLMPEGGQDEVRTLRPLVKGMFRIAFATQDILKDSDTVKIVPVGIDYSDYDHSGGHLVVTFGQPIDIRNHYNLYLENQPVAQNRLRDELYCRMAPLMLNVQTKNYYDCFYTAAYLSNLQMLDKLNLDDNETNRLTARKHTVALLQQAEENDSPLLPQLDALCKQWGAKHQDVAFSARVSEYGNRPNIDTLVYIVFLIGTFPLFLYGAILNGIPFLLIKYLTRKAKGTGFQASFVFGLAAVLFPVIYLLMIVIYAFFAPTFLSVVAFALSLPVSLYIMIRYRWKFRFIREWIRNMLKKEGEVEEIREIMKQL